MAPFYGWEETVYFLPLSPQEVLLLIWSTSEGWKSKFTLEPPSGLEPGTLTTRPMLIFNLTWQLHDLALLYLTH